ncbi:MAG: uridine kinase [Bdellovibrionales bacterium]|nr:uridine kinase [Bdellovibrionales bacterium]
MAIAQKISKSSTLIIGVSGGSGSGKTTFARMLRAHLGEESCQILEQDNYYRDLKDQKSLYPTEINFDHPNAIEFSLLVEHMMLLKIGNPVQIPTYDFSTHCRGEKTKLLRPMPILVLDGILILSQPKVRQMLDISFYVDTHEDLRFARRLARDTRERGRTPEGVYHQFYKQVKPMHDEFVEPSRQYAKKIISGEKSFGPVIEEFVYGLHKQTQVPEAIQLHI